MILLHGRRYPSLPTMAPFGIEIRRKLAGICALLGHCGGVRRFPFDRARLLRLYGAP